MRVLVTGVAGFIGYHLASCLLEEGNDVHGYDGVTSYYDIALKESRLSLLGRHQNFTFTKGMLEDQELVETSFLSFRPDVVIHLAAQAGVRYSLENPRSYIDSNVVGTFNVMEVSRKCKVKHLLMASTSSVYGANTDMPFYENQDTTSQLTIYAATKKATESMGHSYAHLHKVPTTMFRFFTVYGPWGRPDMALFKFTKGIIEETPIDIYNNGEMFRDFTYIDDLVKSISLLIQTPPSEGVKCCELDTISQVAPFRIVNIGNSQKIRLMDFVKAIEDEVGQLAIKNFMPMQKGDVLATWADTSLLNTLTGFRPSTDFRVGVRAFIDWYRSYYDK